MRTAAGADDDSVVPVHATPALAAQVLVDEMMIAAFRHPRLLPGPDDFTVAARELAEAQELFAANGWLDRPASYHRDPDPPERAVVHGERFAGMRYERMSWPSGWEPYPDEPGRERWLSYQRNRTAYAWLAPAAVDTGAWLVCVHGFGMGGRPVVDLRAFRSTHLTARGLNVAVAVLPMHGPRAAGRARGEGFMTVDLVDSMHGLAQAAWDVRRLVAWLRSARGAERVGLIGHSLGGCVAALVAGLEPDLSCVIAGVPVVDLPDLYRRHSTPEVARHAASTGVLGEVGDAVHRPVSPLAMPCQVAVDRRFVFAGLGDRMATFGHAHRLWRHWDRPALASYPGGHVGFFMYPAVQRFVADALTRSGLLPRLPVSRPAASP